MMLKYFYLGLIVGQFSLDIGNTNPNFGGGEGCIQYVDSVQWGRDSLFKTIREELGYELVSSSRDTTNKLLEVAVTKLPPSEYSLYTFKNDSTKVSFVLEVYLFNDEIETKRVEDELINLKNEYGYYFPLKIPIYLFRKHNCIYLYSFLRSIRMREMQDLKEVVKRYN